MHLIFKCILWILFCWCSSITDINLVLQSKSQYGKHMTESQGLESFTVLSSEIQSFGKMLIISLSVIRIGTVNHHNSTQHLRTLLKNGNFWQHNTNHKCPPPQVIRRVYIPHHFHFTLQNYLKFLHLILFISDHVQFLYVAEFDGNIWHFIWVAV